MATQRAGKTILLTGGGTGGHITPLLAVAHALKQADPTVRTVYVGEHGGKFKDLTDAHEAIDETYEIWAGKFRRYNGESWIRRLFDIKTNLLNIRDLFYFVYGTMQSWLLVRRVKPDMIFLKGGFVGVPIGLAARLRKIPFITHDSDAIPGLANRLVGRWAKLHAVALAPDMYRYPASRTVQVGVLVEPSFTEVTSDMQKEMKQQLHINPNHIVLLVTGGSSGARNINIAMKKLAPQLLEDFPNLHIVHQAGRGKADIYGSYIHERLTVVEFMRPMFVYTGSADLVISRASGNTIAELGTQRKAVIAVPNPLLASGHQTKNAQALAEASAAVVVPESARATDEKALDIAIRSLISDASARQHLADNLHGITVHGAAEHLAKLLLQ